MASVRAHIVASPQWDRWAAGFTNLEDDLADHAEDPWEQATELFFTNTQQAVHILSGDLKASGRYDIERDRSVVTGSVTYGGTMGTEGEVDYAVYEFRRGGEHDALAVGWEKTERVFADTLGDIWAKTVEDWD